MNQRRANLIYRAIKDDDDCIRQLRNRRKSLAMDCADPEKALELTSFTLNGQSGAGETVRKDELLLLISNVLEMVDNDAEISLRTSRVSF